MLNGWAEEVCFVISDAAQLHQAAQQPRLEGEGDPCLAHAREGTRPVAAPSLLVDDVRQIEEGRQRCQQL